MNENYCLITGVVVGKDRNANHKDMKRPILDIEIITDGQDSTSFEKLSVLFSNNILAKSVPGYQIGEILTITGELHMDKKSGLYVEAEYVTRMQPKSGRLQGLAISRSELMQLSHRFNRTNVVGVIKDENTLTVPRVNYTKGDLTKEDDIPVISTEDLSTLKGKRVSCIGTLEKRNDQFYLIINKLFIIE